MWGERQQFLFFRPSALANVLAKSSGISVRPSITVHFLSASEPDGSAAE